MDLQTEKKFVLNSAMLNTNNAINDQKSNRCTFKALKDKVCHFCAKFAKKIDKQPCPKLTPSVELLCVELMLFTRIKYTLHLKEA